MLCQLCEKAIIKNTTQNLKYSFWIIITKNVNLRFKFIIGYLTGLIHLERSPANNMNGLLLM